MWFRDLSKSPSLGDRKNNGPGTDFNFWTKTGWKVLTTQKDVHRILPQVKTRVSVKNQEKCSRIIEKVGNLNAERPAGKGSTNMSIQYLDYKPSEVTKFDNNPPKNSNWQLVWDRNKEKSDGYETYATVIPVRTKSLLGLTFRASPSRFHWPVVTDLPLSPRRTLEYNLAMKRSLVQDWFPLVCC